MKQLQYIGPMFIALAFFACTSERPTGKKEGGSFKVGEQEEVIGRSVYYTHCKNCHGSSGGLGFSNAFDLRKSTMSEEEAYHIVREGRETMPVFSETLSEQEIKDVVQYIQKFKGE